MYNNINKLSMRSMRILALTMAVILGSIVAPVMANGTAEAASTRYRANCGWDNRVGQFCWTIRYIRDFNRSWNSQVRVTGIDLNGARYSFGTRVYAGGTSTYEGTVDARYWNNVYGKWVRVGSGVTICGHLSDTRGSVNNRECLGLGGMN